MPAAHRVRQFFGALTARRAEGEERELIDGCLSGEQRALFYAMPANDQRHALNVLRTLLAAGQASPPLLQAALLHDAGKAQTGIGLFTRVALVLLQRFDRGLLDRLAKPRGARWRQALYVHTNHAALGASLAAAAGSAPEVVRLVRNHDGQPEDDLARALQDADEEN